MLPIGDENPHPPGFKPKLTYAFIAINVIIFFFEVAVTGEFFEFTNPNAAKLGEVEELKGITENVIVGSQIPIGSGTVDIFMKSNTKK